MIAPERAIVALAAGISRSGIEVGYSLGGCLLNHSCCLRAPSIGAQDSLPSQAHLGDGLAALSKEPGSNGHDNPLLIIYPDGDLSNGMRLYRSSQDCFFKGEE
jgi:hypothetical protein